MRFILGFLALFLCSCADQPFVAPTPIAKLNIEPVKQGNKAISEGNKKIGQSAQALQTQLVTVRDRLDAAIVSAHEQKEQNAQLDANLRDASAALNAAITENTNLRTTIYTQQQQIDFQGETIDQLFQSNETRQKTIDAQTKELGELRQYKANKAEEERLDHRWWGLGYFLHGAKVLGWHLAIVAVVLAVVGFLLNMFVPFLQPFFQAIIRFFISLPGRIAAFIIGLFKKRPPS